MTNNEKAQQHWQDGLNLWKQGLHNEENADGAANFFLQAWEEDPTFIEALVGLHHLIPEERSELLEKMIPYASGFASSGEVHSFYQPLIWYYVDLRDEADLRRAWAKELYSRGDLVLAEEQLSMCPDDALTQISRADLLFHAEQYEECLQLLQRMQEIPDELTLEVQILRALVLRRMGLMRPAFELLESLQGELNGQRQKLFVMYEQGLILLDIGEDKIAESLFENIYAEDMNYRDVANLLGRVEEDERAWENIVQQLRSGDLAESPDILDNL